MLEYSKSVSIPTRAYGDISMYEYAIEIVFIDNDPLLAYQIVIIANGLENKEYMEHSILSRSALLSNHELACMYVIDHVRQMHTENGPEMAIPHEVEDP